MPLLADEYLFRAILIPFLILALAALGLNVLVGYCGQISLGTGAFMAVGRLRGLQLLRPRRRHADAGGDAARRPVRDHWSACVFGIPSLRIKGLYLAVATLAAQFFVDWAFLRIKLVHQQLARRARSRVAGLKCSACPIDTPVQKYLFCLAFVACSRCWPRTWCAATSAASGWRSATWTWPPR